jgi:hypothetical protein
MKRALPFVVAGGLVVAAGSAFAQGVGNPALGIPPHALGSPAPAPASNPAAEHAAAATGDTPEARNATAALNLLEARGYANFSNFTGDGNAFHATVVNNGQPIEVSINPNTGEIGGV